MSELVFSVEEDIDGGLTARALGQSIFAQGETRDQLLQNIRDAVHRHFDSPENLPKVICLHPILTPLN